MVVILFNIRSKYNVGSIFRTADAAGFKKIYICGITPAPKDRFGRDVKEITKVSLGAEKYMDWEKCGSSPLPQKTISLIKKLKRGGYKILALEQDRKSVSYEKIDALKNKKIALIVGDEVRGLPQSILKEADKIFEIPMKGKKESLNVAVAFGIAAFSLTK